MSPIASNDQDYNLDTTGLSLAPSAEEENAVELSKVQSKSRELINDNQHIVDKRRFIRRVGTERRIMKFASIQKIGVIHARIAARVSVIGSQGIDPKQQIRGGVFGSPSMACGRAARCRTGVYKRCFSK